MGWGVGGGRGQNNRALTMLPPQVIAVDLSSDYTLLATGGVGTTTMIWDLESGRNIYALDCGSRVMATCFSKDVTLLASTSYTGAACVWSLQDGSMLFEMQMCPGPVFCVQLTHTGESHVLTTGDFNGWATIRDVGLKGQNKRRYGVKGDSAVRCLSLSNDLELLGTGHQSGQVLLWNVRTEEPIWSTSCGAIVYSMDMSLDKTLLVTG